MNNLAYLKNIDIKSYNFPWCNEGWEDIGAYKFKIIFIKEVPRAFACYKTNKNGSIFLSKFCVNPIWWNMGIGTMLWHKVLNETRGKKLTTIVNERTPLHTFNWMKKLGWKGVGIKEGLYPDGSHGFVMESTESDELGSTESDAGYPV